MKLLGIDNVFFEVADLEKALSFYEKLGFKKKIDIPQLKAILFSIGEEEPGLIICQKKTVSPSKLWVEVESAEEIKTLCHSLGIPGKDIQTITGVTFEVSDDAGNYIGFADYSIKPELARSPQSIPFIKAIAEDYADRIWNKKDLSAIDDYLDKAVVIHSLLGDYHGIEAMKEVVRAWFKAFPDLIVSNIAEIGEKDTIVLHWKAQGTHRGEFKGRAPTGKKVSYAGVTIYRIQKHKIVEYWAYLDMQHLLGLL